jgi:hypothetical protein
MARRNSSRDESAYYQAETATLTRENQMLRLRIRELERQVNELNANAGATQALPNTARTESILNPSPSREAGASDGQAARIAPGEFEKD